MADRAFFSADPCSLAVALIGATLVRRAGDGTRLSGRIVETEAYCGAEDLAAHSVGWRRTARTEPMFGPGGTAYVFMTYGMHCCFNVVCGDPGEPVAVLIRAVEPLEGLEVMRANRRLTATGRPRARPLKDRELCSGPARLCQAMGIDRTLSGTDLTTDAGVWIEPRPAGIRPALVNRPRVGVDYAGAWASRPLRWYDGASEHVSVR